MSRMASINFRTDAKLKNEFARTVEEIGLSVSSALTVFMKAVVRQRKIPFTLEAEAYTEDELEALEMLDDPNTKYYSSAEEMARDQGWI